MNKFIFLAAFATTLLANGVAHAAPHFDPDQGVVMLEGRPSGPNQSVVMLEGRSAGPFMGTVILEARPSAASLGASGKRVDPFKDQTAEPIVQ